MTGNHWTVFNGAGAVVADNMPLDVVHAYMTPGRFARGWHAAYCLVVRCEEDLPPLGDSRNLPAEKQE
jgi:hypothetical protein